MNSVKNESSVAGWRYVDAYAGGDEYRNEPPESGGSLLWQLLNKEEVEDSRRQRGLQCPEYG